MNEKEKEQEQKYLEAVDVSYSYGLAKAMERIKSNPVLGFRTAGSRAEYETGEMLRQEMERIGLEDIHKDRLCLDGWEFEKAVLRFRDAEGAEHVFQLGAYQTQFLTGAFRNFRWSMWGGEEPRTMQAGTCAAVWFWWTLTRGTSGGSTSLCTRPI